MIRKKITSALRVILLTLFLAALGAGIYSQSTVLAATSNDPLLDRQSYLEHTGTIQAWDKANRNGSITIAIIDTGVDLEHPDLKGNLITGINLLQPALPPRDDNGHGTNVAGVIAALGNNGKGVAGMLWKTNIMPIKALEPNGRGDEDKLAEGIRYAVDKGAKIVVLSVGLQRNDPHLYEIVQYAESRDVLLVAATGNDEGRNIRYPAAYPTVLAVGGIGATNTIEERSNYGPELDLVAPWSVFTTAMGGKYEYRDGTSMAAPQVAAAAALIWELYPNLKAHEVRNLLRQTAEDVGPPGWDEKTGYGLLRVDRALTEPHIADIYEPNHSKETAKPYAIGRMISAELRDGSDEDWFRLDAPYDGVLKLELLGDKAPPSEVTLMHYTDDRPGTAINAVAGQPIEVEITRGSNWFVIRYSNKTEASGWKYRLTNSFTIYRDPFEDNDRQYKAFKLAPRSQTVTGTFDKQGDEDWYAMTFEQSGTVTVTVTPDSKRIDPLLQVQKKGERPVTLDDNADGEPEIYRFNAFPGTYYFLVSKLKLNPSVGEYTLDIKYEPKYIDPHEPNDRSYQATVISLDTPYEGVFDHMLDMDNFKFNVMERSLIRISLAGLPIHTESQLHLLNGGLGLLARETSRRGSDSMDLEIPLNEGVYYVRLTSSEAYQEQMYKLVVHADKLAGGFADIAGHWAGESILALSELKILEGYGAYRFYPDQRITRAEAAAMLVRAFGYSEKGSPSFIDVPKDHWAYNAAAIAAQAGIVRGYPDGRFEPDGTLSRGEMAAMLARVLGLAGKPGGENPFLDMKPDHWALPVIKQMKAEGWIDGYGDGTFRPDQETTRAEIAHMLMRIIRR